MYGPIMGGPPMSLLAREGFQPAQRTERIPTPPPRYQADMGMPQRPMMQGLGSQSQSLFDQYMNQAFMQRYRPQIPLGGYQNMGLFGGFYPQMMPRQMIGAGAANQVARQPIMPANLWSISGDQLKDLSPGS